MTTQLRDGTTVEDSRLGRLVQYDDRSKDFPVSAAPRVADQPFPTVGRGWSVRHWLNQRSTPHCVSFSWHHEALALPARAVFESDDAATQIAHNRYFEMQKLDEWAGEDYDGTSVLAGAKFMKNQGYFDSYRWCFELRDIIMALAYEGPVVMGTNWYEGMYDPDSDGFIHVEGDNVGGHAWLIPSFSVKHKFVRIWNSWGDDWGDRGRAKISWDDLEKLLINDGEGCVPIDRHVI